MRMTKKILGIVLILFFSACQKEVQEIDSLQLVSKSPEAGPLDIPHFQPDPTRAKPMVATFTAHLTGKAEVPPVETMATGEALFQLSKDGESMSYRLIVANIENVTMAHIHLAPAGQNGPVVLWLYPAGPPPELIPGFTNGVLSTGVVTADDLVGELAGSSLDDLLEKIENGDAYVNVHTTQFPGGEIRGQIR